MKQRKYILAFAFFFLFPILVCSGTPCKFCREIVLSIKENISLTDEQELLIFRKAEIYINQVRELDTSTNVEEWLPIKEKLNEDFETAVNEILTETQREELIYQRELKRKAMEMKYSSNI